MQCCDWCQGDDSVSIVDQNHAAKLCKHRIKIEEQTLKRLLKVAAIFYFTMAAAICYLKFHRGMRIFDLNLDPFGYTNDENTGLSLIGVMKIAFLGWAS
jgi:hypothetical protein